MEQLAAEGFIEEAPYDALARLLLGVFLEAGIYITHAPDRVKARREMLQGLEYLFNSLRINRPPIIRVQPGIPGVSGRGGGCWPSSGILGRILGRILVKSLRRSC